MNHRTRILVLGGGSGAWQPPRSSADSSASTTTSCQIGGLSLRPDPPVNPNPLAHLAGTPEDALTEMELDGRVVVEGTLTPTVDEVVNLAEVEPRERSVCDSQGIRAGCGFTEAAHQRTPFRAGHRDVATPERTSVSEPRRSSACSISQRSGALRACTRRAQLAIIAQG
jgi:hypothetical protein